MKLRIWPLYSKYCIACKVKYYSLVKGKVKAVPLQAWSGPEVSRNLTFADFMTKAQDGGKVSLMHRPPLPPENKPGTNFY
jgi:hypothetical protein